MQVTLAKALKIKNKLTGEIARISQDIVSYNSAVKGSNSPFNLRYLMARRKELVDMLIALKDKLSAETQPIQPLIHKMAENKSTIAFLNSIPTKSGTEARFHVETPIEYVSEFSLPEIRSLVEALTREVESIQDQLDKFNHDTLVKLPDTYNL